MTATFENCIWICQAANKSVQLFEGKLVFKIRASLIIDRNEFGRNWEELLEDFADELYHLYSNYYKILSCKLASLKNNEKNFRKKATNLKPSRFRSLPIQ